MASSLKIGIAAAHFSVSSAWNIIGADKICGERANEIESHIISHVKILPVCSTESCACPLINFFPHNFASENQEVQKLRVN